jgi:hypothetical protein
MFRWIALISAIFLVITLAGMILSSQQPSEPAPQQSAEKNSKERTAEKNEVGLFDRWFPDSTAVFNLFLAIFTGVLAFGGLIQLNLLTRAERIAANAANAAKESADATKKTAEIAEITLRVTQRAYIFADSFGVQDFGEGLAPSIVSRERNLGATPAYKVRSFTATFGADWPLPADFELPLVDRSKLSDPIVLPRDVTYTRRVRLSAPLTQQQVAAIEAGTQRLIVFGRIEYFDRFDQPHFTKWCFSYGSTEIRSGIPEAVARYTDSG